MERTVLAVLYGLLLFVTPLIIIPTTSELFELNKMIVIYTIAALALFVYLVRCLRTGNWPAQKPFFIIALMIFLAVQGLSTLYSIDRLTSIIGYYGRFNGGLISFMAYAALALVAAYAFVRDDVVKLLKTSVAASALVMMWGLPSRYGYDLTCWIFTGKLNSACWTDQFRPAERMFSTLGQPNWLGSYLVINLFVSLALFLWYLIAKKNRHIRILAIYIVLNIACILFTKSRSSLAAVAAGGAVFLPLVLSLRNTRNLAVKHMKIFALMGMAIILLILNTFVGTDWIKAPNKNVQKVGAAVPAAPPTTAPVTVTDSLDIRTIVWQGAWHLALKYPLLGTGPETFAYAYTFVRPMAHNATSEWDFVYNKAHNELLNYLATTGFAGLASYLFFIGVPYVYIARKVWILKSTKDISPADYKHYIFYSAMAAALTGIHVTNFFGFSTSTVNLALFLAPAFLTAYDRTTIPAAVRKKFKHRYLFIGAASIGTLGALLWIAAFFVADTRYAYANEQYAQGEYYIAAGSLQSALRLHREHIYEDKLSSTLANIALIAPFTDGDTNKPEHYISLSDALNTKTLRETPLNVQYWRTRGKNHYLFFQSTLEVSYLDEAIAAISKTMDLAPTDPKYPYTQALFLSLRADETDDKKQKEQFERQAIAYVKRASMQKPDYIDARALHIKLLDKSGDTEEAARLREVFNKDFPHATREAEL